ncbi:MAG: hypothetical protein P9L89_04085 [Candidatus Celaenobacter polaris]|nr:hypothetical protein [Candidatus Celaenobacter polaris]
MKIFLTSLFKTTPAEGRENIEDNRNECRSMGFFSYYFTNLGIGKENHTLLFTKPQLGKAYRVKI